MPDKFFYPFIVVFVAAAIFIALNVGGGVTTDPGAQIDPVAEGYVAEGEGLRAIVASPGTTIDFALNQEGEPAYVTAAAHMRRAEAPPSAGVFVELSPLFEGAFAQQDLEITVRARKSSGTPSERFQMAYYTASVGDSPTQNFDLTGQFQDYTIRFKPNAPKGDPATDFVGVWPDLSGQSGAMDIEKISVKVITPATQNGSGGE